jgi:hypothetical protein
LLDDFRIDVLSVYGRSYLRRSIWGCVTEVVKIQLKHVYFKPIKVAIEGGVREVIAIA